MSERCRSDPGTGHPRGALRCPAAPAAGRECPTARAWCFYNPYHCAWARSGPPRPPGTSSKWKQRCRGRCRPGPPAPSELPGTASPRDTSGNSASPLLALIPHRLHVAPARFTAFSIPTQCLKSGAVRAKICGELDVESHCCFSIAVLGKMRCRNPERSQQ